MIRTVLESVLARLGLHRPMTDVVEQEANKAVDETAKLAGALEDLSHKADAFATLVHNMRGASFRGRVKGKP